jgi:hypothetical protein
VPSKQSPGNSAPPLKVQQSRELFYRRFMEEFDTRDLREAKALLDGLAGSPFVMRSR